MRCRRAQRGVRSPRAAHHVRARQERSAAEKRVVCLDAYATWCPPCRTAAPVFARMSEEYTAVTFAKVSARGRLARARPSPPPSPAQVNVEEARDVAATLGITAMPTFKLFRGRTELASVRGFDQKQLRAALKEHGSGAKRD